MAYLDYNGLAYFKQKNDALYAKATDLSNLSDVVAQKANIDGSYELLTSGNAEQLVSTVGVENNAPYVFRTTGGSADVGDRMNLKAVVGGTVAWNQLVQNANITFTSESTDTRALFFVLRKSASPYTTLFSKQNVQTGILASIIASSFDGYAGMTHSGSQRNIRITPVDGFQLVNGHKYYFKVNFTGVDTSTVGGIVAKDIQVYDLTAMFGSAIADYAYTLESGTAGSGIAWLKSYGFFTKPYYPYAAANLQSVKTSAHITYGFNAYDNSTGKAKVVGGMMYQITGAYTALSLDGTTITPDANGYFTPSANGELTVTGGNDTTTCVHLKWDGERDGEFEQFEQHTYAIDDVELRGIPKLDASNNLYYDGDVYTPDGTVARRYDVVDLGTLSWTKASDGVFTNATNKGYKIIGHSDMPNIICPKYVTETWQSINSGTQSDKSIHLLSGSSTKQIRIFDSEYTDKDTFTAAMSGVYLVFELETPTTESADAYTELQICNDFGTEEFVDAATRDFEMPCGSNAVYQPNLRAKLEMAPNSPSNGNGDYIVRQTDGVNEYVLLSEVKELPDLPTTDGTYTLKCTVADGTATLSWVSE